MRSRPPLDLVGLFIEETIIDLLRLGPVHSLPIGDLVTRDTQHDEILVILFADRVAVVEMMELENPLGLVTTLASAPSFSDEALAKCFPCSRFEVGVVLRSP